MGRHKQPSNAEMKRLAAAGIASPERVVRTVNMLADIAAIQSINESVRRHLADNQARGRQAALGKRRA